MNEHDIISQWKSSKLGRNFYRLRNAASCDFQFKGQPGHPSSYAYISFECFPSDELSYESQAKWPDSLPLEYCEQLNLAIAEGIVDVLYDHIYPYRGCNISLIKIRWDEIGGSEYAFYKATKLAMEKLVKDYDWEIITVT